MIDDSILFGLWIAGLAGGIGLLLGKLWSGATLGLSFALFVLPVVALCAATIYTLREDAPT